MTQPTQEQMAKFRRDALQRRSDDGPLARRAVRAMTGWLSRGNLNGESPELLEMTRYTGGRF
jgi:hypothetical protein